MKRTALISALALVTLFSPAYASEDAAIGLSTVRGLFRRMDTDGNGEISALEAGRNHIPSKDFVAYDSNRDRRLSQAEFTLFYRQLVIRSGRKVAADLDAEAARITAARRAKRADEVERREQARKKALEEARRAEAARESEREAQEAARAEKARQEADRTGAGKSGSEGKPTANPGGVATPGSVQSADPPPAPPEEGLSDAQRAEKARAEKQAQDAARAAKARAEKQAQDAARAQKAREEKQAQDAARAAQARAEAEAAEAARRRQEEKDEAATPEERAAGYVKRLVKAGRLTTQQARDFYTLLTAPPSGSSDAVAVDTLRTALAAAKRRITSLVVAGALTSEEGRQLSQALDARAKAALPAQGGTERKAGSGRRTAKPKDAGAARSRDGGKGVRSVGRVKNAGTVRPVGSAPQPRTSRSGAQRKRD